MPTSFAPSALTGKELDPDFIDFNSQNSRYHFPARFYVPFWGLFAQVDTLQIAPQLLKVAQQLYYSGVYVYPTMSTQSLPSPGRSSHWHFTVLLAVGFLTTALLIACFVRCLRCPNCDWNGNIMEVGARNESLKCATCRGEGRVTPLRWLSRHGAR